MSFELELSAKNSLEGPPSSSYAIGGEFDGAVLNDEIWGGGNQ